MKRALWVVAATALLVLVIARVSDLDDAAWTAGWRSRWNRTLAELPPGSATPDPVAPDILLLVMDTVRADAILDTAGRIRSGPLADLNDQARVFTRAYSTSCWTVPAHASLLTGLYPDRHQATQLSPRLGEGYPTLAEQLTDRGYETIGIVENPYIGVLSRFGRGFGAYFDAFRGLSSLTLREAKGWEAFLGFSKLKLTFTPDLVEAAVQAAPADRPLFLFVNLLDAHRPYIPLPSSYSGPWYRYPVEVFHQYRYNLRRWYTGDADRAPEAVARLRRLYDDEVGETERKARDVVERLRSRNRPSLIILVSDHGENFGEGGHYDHVFTLRESVVRVPLVLIGQGLTAGRVSDPVNLIDVHRTVLAAAGLETGEGADLRGSIPNDRSLLLEYAYPQETLGLFTDTEQSDPRLTPFKTARAAVVRGDWKLEKSADGLRLSNISPDFDEDKDLAVTEAGTVSSLVPMVNDAFRRMSEMQPATQRTLDDQTRRQLQSLGYLQ